MRVQGHTLTVNNSLLTSLPQTVSSVGDVRLILNFLNSCSLCIGNSEEKYIPLAKNRKGKFMNCAGKIIICPIGHSFVGRVAFNSKV